MKPVNQDTENLLLTLTIQLLKPARITRALIQHELRRAKRLNHPWRQLTQTEKALLKAAAQTPIQTYKPTSQTTKLLAIIIAKIETYTMRGKTIQTGLKRILTRKLISSTRILQWAKEKLDYILYLGRNLLTLQQYYYSSIIGII
ncbi:MAG: hypothetical protein GSR79_00470 [Desulfurococcales archaeon]|nr:hypothetical protein [Desulfurococcales archaeon]